MNEGLDPKTEDVTYVAINIGELRSDATLKADGDFFKYRRCNNEFELIPMSERMVKELFESIGYSEIIDHRVYDAKKFRAWLYGDRKTPPKVLNWELREKYTIPANMRSSV
jgi:hypothetical protein